jgi:hypothetical protein
MAFFAQGLDVETSAKMQAEMAEQRRIAEMLKAIDNCHANMMTSLSILMRHRDGSRSTAAQALKSLYEAREEQDRLFRELLGIDDGQPRISKA